VHRRGEAGEGAVNVQHRPADALVSQPADELDDADLAIALDIIDLRFRALEIASHEDLAPEGVAALANYYFNFGITGLIVPYPVPDAPGKKKLKAVT
jgi:hypothetical protein